MRLQTLAEARWILAIFALLMIAKLVRFNLVDDRFLALDFLHTRVFSRPGSRRARRSE